MSKFKKAVSQMMHVLRDQERKSLPRIAFEAAHSAILVRELPIHYFTHLLYKVDVVDYTGYMGFKKGTHIKFDVLPKQNAAILNDKSEFGTFLSRHGVPTPITVATSESKRLVWNERSILLETSDQLKAELCRIADANDLDELFVKPNDGVNGVNSFRIVPEGDSSRVEKLYSLMGHADFIFQKVVQQHPDLSILNQSSVNTARMHVHYDGEKADVVSGFLRMGVGGMEVDNGSSGGIFIPINFDTWALEGRAQQHLSRGGRMFRDHPDSGVVLDGHKLPFKEETFEILKTTAELVGAPIVGWDVAFTPDGPIIIEGNFTFDIFMCQKTCGGFVNHPKYSKIFAPYLG